MSKIAVIGIAGESVFLALDEFGKIGETTVAKDIHRELGGKGFNQAVTIARYGVECSFLCAVNKKDVEKFSSVAKSVGITPFFIPKEEESPYAVIITDKNGSNSVCVYRGAALDEADVDMFEEKIKSSDILLINNETPIEVNKKAVNLAKKYGRNVILNPAPAYSYDDDFLKQIDLFTPNEHETDGLESFENVIVTLGEKGCLIKSMGEIIPPYNAERVVDTTGAGDTFNGVLAACLSEGADIKTACKKANLAASIKVSKKYILNSIPTKNEITEREVKNG